MKVLTDWFPASVKPVRKGEYMVRSHASDPVPFLLIWTGYCWRTRFGYSYGTVFEWRGLAFDPAAADFRRGVPGEIGRPDSARLSE